jgi:hypothetical protein
LLEFAVLDKFVKDKALSFSSISEYVEYKEQIINTLNNQCILTPFETDNRFFELKC